MSEQYEHKDNSGSVFKNDKKETKTHPDYKGSAKIDGVAYWIAAWVNETKGGKKYLKLSFEVQGEQEGTGGSAPTGTEEDIPF